MKYLTEKEEKSFVRTVREIKGKKAERDHVIIELLLSVGLRAAELVGLNVGDVRNQEKLWIRPEIAKRKVTGKEGKDKSRAEGRFVPLDKDMQKSLKTFFRQKLTWRESIRDDAPLFVSRNGERLSKRSLQEAIEGWMIRTGLTTTRAGKVVALYSTHSLRHTCFKRMMERGMLLTTVQKIAGHATLASTGIYTEATWEEMVEAVEARR